jgi:hypothetical protein
MANPLRDLARYGQSLWYDGQSLRAEALLERGDQAGLEALLASVRA